MEEACAILTYGRQKLGGLSEELGAPAPLKDPS